MKRYLITFFWLVAMLSIFMSETFGQINFNVVTTKSTCGNADGSAMAFVSEGQEPYTYAWSSGDTIDIAENLSAGIYMVTVTDASGVANFRVVPITDKEGPTIEGSITDISCFGGKDGMINLDAIGGMQPFKYVWSTGARTPFLIGLVTGPYEVVVKDVNNCIGIKRFFVNQPSKIGISVNVTSSTVGSSDGDINSTATGGTPPYNYKWSNNAMNPDLTDLEAGIYHLTITDANGCTASTASKIALSDVDAPVITVESIQEATCGNADGAVFITIIGGLPPYLIQWSTGFVGDNLIGVSPGVYDVVVTDQSGFRASESVVVPLAVPVKPEICVTTVDSATGKNLIVWQKESLTDITSYKIYKESTQSDLFFFIDDLPVDSLSVFVDTFSNPRNRSWRYKISAINACYGESEVSGRHKTIHLVTKPIQDTMIGLVWDHYNGFSYSFYYIYRYSDAGKELLDSVPPNKRAYVDKNPPLDEQLHYSVAINLPDICAPKNTAKTVGTGGPYSQSVSNLEDNMLPPLDYPDPPIVFDREAAIFKFMVYPNPSNGIFNIKYSLDKEVEVDISVYNLLGKEVIKIVDQQQMKNDYSYQLSLSEYGHGKGIYFIKVKIDSSVFIKKIIQLEGEE